MAPCRDRGVGFLTLDLLSAVEGFRHGFFTRRGGVSPPPFDSLNLSASTGDSQENVNRNIRRAGRALGFERLVSVHQVHGARVVAVDGRPLAEGRTELAKADGLVTDRPGLGLMIKLADCLGIILVHPPTRTVAAIHAGWRGLISGVIPAGVRAMVQGHGARPEEIKAGISPSLGPCCAEFVNYQREFPRSFWAYRVGRDHFDLWALARDQLQESGLREGNIEAAGLCSRCRGDLFFSHRGQGPVTGRMGLLAGFAE